MARLEKQQLLKLSETTEAIYQDMEDELLVLIAEYLARGENAYTIAELLNKVGQLSEEAMRIIAKYSKKSVKEVEDIMEEAMMIALEDIENQLQDAAEAGHIQKAPTLKESERVNNVIQEAARGSRIKMQQMNNIILNSVVVEYQTAVNDIFQEKQRLEVQRADREVRYDPEDLAEPYRGAVREITEDREITSIAIERAIDRMADEGITGFIDSAGRHWQADTYATMVIRTNAHNVAIDATRARQEDYGTDLFQISSHNGARPLCYPYQGKIYSWTSATSGAFKDGAGVKWEYGSLENDTSYGEPAGIFGINCGHHPLPIIPGVSIVHEQPVQDPEENAKEYQESQKQRYLERQIREAKRLYEMQRVSGADKETLKRYKQNIENKQQNMREFIDETGRTRRYDREKIQQQAKTPSYSTYQLNSTKNELEALNTIHSMYENQRLANDLTVIPISSIYEKDTTISVDYGKMSSKLQESTNKVLQEYNKRFISTLQKIEAMDEHMAESNSGSAAFTITNDEFRRSILYYNPEHMEKLADYRKYVKAGIEDGTFVKVDEDMLDFYVITHEYAHSITGSNYAKESKVGYNQEKTKEAQKQLQALYERYMAATEADKTNVISEYSRENVDEFMAEAFVEQTIGESKNSYAIEAMIILDEFYGR